MTDEYDLDPEQYESLSDGEKFGVDLAKVTRDAHRSGLQTAEIVGHLNILSGVLVDAMIQEVKVMAMMQDARQGSVN